MTILVLNGPNINMLGIREPEIYGKQTYADLVMLVQTYCKKNGIKVKMVQTNHEGTLVTLIQKAYGKYDGIVINPAAYTHTSVAVLDAVKSVGIPTVEVHISDPDKREEFRHVSYVRAACVKTIAGRGFQGYVDAIEYLKDNYKENK